ncbi:MAG TPA: hypothetical protein VLZ83_11025 [Edaphocola sp.]|nr:hypothetical protein [Edaphocola sp.]
MKQFNLIIKTMLLTFLALFGHWFCIAQDKILMHNIDSIVAVINKTYETCDSIILNNEEFLSESTDGGGELIIYNCKNKLAKIEEWIGLSYGYRLRTFYSKDNKLIYVSEVHNEFKWNEDKNEYDTESTHQIYSSFYYIENDFYHYGKMTYESEYKQWVEAPEPIGYVIKLVKTNKEYRNKN